MNSFKTLLALCMLAICHFRHGTIFQLSITPNLNKFILVIGSEDEERLVRDLFRGYNKLIRPVQNMTQKVDVRFGLAFVQLINVVSFYTIKNSNVLCTESLISERKESNYEVKCLVAISLE